MLCGAVRGGGDGGALCCFSGWKMCNFENNLTRDVGKILL